MTLPDSVVRAIREGFSQERWIEAEALLATYGAEPHEREPERVMLCILRLAEGDLARARELVGRAKRDYRDVLLWAEHPAAAALDSPAKIDAFNAMLERFGASWRIPERDEEQRTQRPGPAGARGSAMDELERNKRVARRFVEEVVNTGSVDLLADLVSADCVETDGKVRIVSGVAGMAQHVLAVRAVYPDLHLTIERQIAEGEWVASVITARGTHEGEWLGMAPTGRVLVFTVVNVDRVVDGKLVEHGGAANMLEPFLAAGSLRPAPR